MPTDYVGEKPEWEEFKQKGNKCVSTTSAAVPCKDPIPGYLEIDLSMTTKAINMDKKILLWHIQYTFKSIQNTIFRPLIITQTISAGGKCEDKYNWSNEGWIESKVECIKIPGGVKRREYRQECFFKDGEFQCWKHWSSTGCSITSCQSDKMDNNGMGFGKDKKTPRGG